jgi:integrase
MKALERVGIPDDRDVPIFRTSSGQPPSASQLRRPLLALCKAAEVPQINVHGLRHVHAALVYASTRDVYAVKARLGHSDVSFTMRQYGYGTGSDADTAAAVDGMLGGVE